MPVANRQEECMARDEDKKKIVLQISKNSVSLDAQRCVLGVDMSYQNQVKLQNAYASKTPGTVGRQTIRNMTEWCREQC